jgi:hypothetical protein
MNIRTAQFVSDENRRLQDFLYGQLSSKHRRLQDFKVISIIYLFIVIGEIA